jgi:hypothetical protein
VHDESRTFLSFNLDRRFKSKSLSAFDRYRRQQSLTKAYA